MLRGQFQGSSPAIRGSFRFAAPVAGSRTEPEEPRQFYPP